jgi:hypothetical protein
MQHQVEVFRNGLLHEPLFQGVTVEFCRLHQSFDSLTSHLHGPQGNVFADPLKAFQIPSEQLGEGHRRHGGGLVGFVRLSIH